MQLDPMSTISQSHVSCYVRPDQVSRDYVSCRRPVNQNALNSISGDDIPFERIGHAITVRANDILFRIVGDQDSLFGVGDRVRPLQVCPNKIPGHDVVIGGYAGYLDTLSPVS